MKNSSKTVVSLLVGTALMFVALSANAFVKNSIKKIIITGNARVTLVQSENESVTIPESDDSRNTSVKMNGLSLMIDSKEFVPLNITVYTQSPYRIEVSNTSIVSTAGTFNVPYLQVILHDKAQANVTTVTKSLYSLINDQSKLKISGIANEHFANYSVDSKLKMDNLACLNTSKVLIKATLLNAKNIIPNKKIIGKKKKMRT
jgi:hypothetical protein